jgi:hypothetical protein
MGGSKLNRPVMSMAPALDGSGYWLVASDGGVFAFDVPFYGSAGNLHLNKPISGMVPGTIGYMMVAQDGGIFSYGNVIFHGSLGSNPPSSPVRIHRPCRHPIARRKGAAGGGDEERRVKRPPGSRVALSARLISRLWPRKGSEPV